MRKKKRHAQLIDLDKVYEAYQLQAIDERLSNNLIYFEKHVRRWYSKTYHTPLQDVYNISWPKLLEEYYSATTEQKPYEELYNAAISQYLPELKKHQDEVDEEFEEALLKEQQETLKKQQSRKNKASPTAVKEDKAPPITNMNLSFNDENPDEDED